MLVGAGLVVLAALLAVGYTSIMAPRYAASSVIVVAPTSSPPSLLALQSPQSPELERTVIVLQSNTLQSEVESRAAVDLKDDEIDVVSHGDPLSQTVTVRVVAGDREVAMRVLNTILEVRREKAVDVLRTRLQREAEASVQAATNLQAELDVATLELLTSAENDTIVASEPEKALETFSRVVEIRAAYNAARQQHEEAKAIALQASDLALDSPALGLSDPVKQRAVLDAQIQVAALEETLGPKAPELLAAREQLNRLSAGLAAEKDALQAAVGQALTPELREIAVEVAGLEAQLELAEESAEALRENYPVLSLSSLRVASLSEAYTQVLTEAEVKTAMADESKPNVQILEPPYLEEDGAPVNKRYFRNTGLAMVGALAIFLIWLFAFPAGRPSNPAEE
ncbi:MAG: hypothetical protein ACOCX1_03830 [Fimbriimonadaceae bacterium]